MSVSHTAILVVGRKFKDAKEVEDFLVKQHVNKSRVNNPLDRDLTSRESMLGDMTYALGLDDNVDVLNGYSNEPAYYIGWHMRLREETTLEDFEDAYNYALARWEEHFGLTPAYIISELQVS